MTRDELNAKLDELEKADTYETTAEAMADAALEAFTYMGKFHGVTGFQAGWAELSFIKKSRRIENFMIVNFDDLLYPQYDVVGKVLEGIDSSKDWLKQKAKEMLKEAKEEESLVHPTVLQHWCDLAGEPIEDYLKLQKAWEEL